MAKRPKVLVVKQTQDVLELLRLLLSESGYQAMSVLMGPAVMEVVKTYGPDLILMDLVQGHADDLAFLDDLRSDPVTLGIPVVAMSTLPCPLDQAIASYNVKQMLLVPFDVADLEPKARAALDQAPLNAIVKLRAGPPKLIFAEVSLALAARSRMMMVRWVQRRCAHTANGHHFQDPLQPFRRCDYWTFAHPIGQGEVKHEGHPELAALLQALAGQTWWHRPCTF